MLSPALLPLLLLSALPSALAQVPRVCVANVTQPNSTCCPPVPGDVTGAPCGGLKRGSCSAVRVMINGTRQAPSARLPDVYDTRMDWPVHLFEYMCQCSFFYSGLACEHSKLDFGPGKGNPFKKFFQPSDADKRTRRNIANLTSAERQHVRDVLVQSKKQLSDWVILNDTAGAHPDGSRKVSYFNVSIYDFFVFLNFYATKGISFNSSFPAPASPLRDLAHKSPNAVPFNRKLLSDFELALDAISRNLTLAKNPNATLIPPFALPYWNWTDQSECEACNDDLLGAMGAADGSLSPASPFASWRVLCQNEEPTWNPCDPTGQRPLLWRSYSEDARFEALPTAAEVNGTLTAPNYDVEPFNETSNSSSFRNLLEGYIGVDNNLTAAEVSRASSEALGSGKCIALHKRAQFVPSFCSPNNARADLQFVGYLCFPTGRALSILSARVDNTRRIVEEILLSS